MLASMAMKAASGVSQGVFLLIVLALVIFFVLAVRRSAQRRGLAPTIVRRQTLASTLLVVGVLTGTGLAAMLGLFVEVAGKPAFMLYPLATFGLIVSLAMSKVGRSIVDHVPISALIGFQAFRLPLELVLHQWYKEGVIPEQMTFTGDNFDIISGILAVAVGLFVHYKGAKVALIWFFNSVGFCLLMAVVRVAILSSPVPFRTYWNEPTLLVALYVPYTWILPICVGGALFGHLLVFRYLLQSRLQMAK